MKTIKNLHESLNDLDNNFVIMICDKDWKSIRVASQLDNNLLLETQAIIEMNKGIIKVKEWDDNVGY